MKYAEVIRHFGPFGFFELPNLIALTHEKKATVLQTLCRWNKKARVVRLKRGFYTLPEDVAKIRRG
jgi:hypothetical protein